jgi:hypothetical protein
MAWSRSKYVLVFLLCSAFCSWGQSQPAYIDSLAQVEEVDFTEEEMMNQLKQFHAFNDSDCVKPWTDEAWKKVADGIVYQKKNKPEEKKEWEDPNPQNEDSVFWDKLRNVFSKGWFQFIIIIVTGALLLVMLMRFFGNGLGLRNSKIEKRLEVLLSELESDITSGNPDDILVKMEALKQFKNALRVWYLKALRELNEKGLVRWKTDKTNASYLRELQGTKYYTEFRELTDIYELVWYGDAEVAEYAYSRLKGQFISFINNVKENE